MNKDEIIDYIDLVENFLGKFVDRPEDLCVEGTDYERKWKEIMELGREIRKQLETEE